MAEASIYARILSLLAELCGETGLAPDTRLKEDLGLDSIELVQLVMTLNHSFGISIHSSELVPANLATVALLAGFVESKLRQQKEQTGGIGT
ncbi:MAG: hypothetical protein CVV27_13130 [Candidatus Melainabacteria bacterium HGW-Melainabacteria-1]|nr:MAG: hypothetical protein CVV27_13130 [Candidatus Melainabacteria bacterium HGW-Melainabacteria-1]